METKASREKELSPPHHHLVTKTLYSTNFATCVYILRSPKILPITNIHDFVWIAIDKPLIRWKIAVEILKGLKKFIEKPVLQYNVGNVFIAH